MRGTELSFLDVSPGDSACRLFRHIRVTYLERENYYRRAAHAVDAWIGQNRAADEPLVVLWLLSRYEVIEHLVDLMIAVDFVAETLAAGAERVVLRSCRPWLLTALTREFGASVEARDGSGLQPGWRVTWSRAVPLLLLLSRKLLGVARLLLWANSRRPTYATVAPVLVKMIETQSRHGYADVLLEPIVSALGQLAPQLRHIALKEVHRNQLRRMLPQDAREYRRGDNFAVETAYLATLVARPWILVRAIWLCAAGERRVRRQLATRRSRDDRFDAEITGLLRSRVRTRYLRAVVEETLWTAFLRLMRPRFVLMWGEYSQTQRVAVRACAALGIRTYAVQHGIIWSHHPGYHYSFGVRGYVPLNDRTFVFGPRYKEILLGNSIYQNANVLVVGNLRFDFYGRNGKDWPNRKCELGRDDELMVLYTCNYPMDTMFEAIVRDLADSKHRVFLVIKLHPHEEGESGGDAYEAVCRRYGYKRFRIVREEIDLYRLLRSVDVHISYYSTVLTEATVLGVPNIALAETSYLGGKQHLSVNLQDYQSMDAALDAALQLPRERQEEYQTFARDYAYRLDGLAGQRAAQTIVQDVSLGIGQADTAEPGA